MTVATKRARAQHAASRGRGTAAVSARISRRGLAIFSRGGRCLDLDTRRAAPIRSASRSPRVLFARLRRARRLARARRGARRVARRAVVPSTGTARRVSSAAGTTCRRRCPRVDRSDAPSRTRSTSISSAARRSFNGSDRRRRHSGSVTLAALAAAAAEPRRRVARARPRSRSWRRSTTGASSSRAHGVLAREWRPPGGDRCVPRMGGSPESRSICRRVVDTTVFVPYGSCRSGSHLDSPRALPARCHRCGPLADSAGARLVLSFAIGKTIQSQFDRAGAGQHALGRYAALFDARDERRRSAAPCYATCTIACRRTASWRPACMRRLNRILGFAMLGTARRFCTFRFRR